jgi:hypothetical protein
MARRRRTTLPESDVKHMFRQDFFGNGRASQLGCGPVTAWAPGRCHRKKACHMKGLVFTTFYEHCEQRYGADMLDDIIDDANLPNKGAYTSVGTYPFDEMVALVTALVRRTGQSLPRVMEEVGAACFAKWVHYVPAHFQEKCLFDVLSEVDHFHEYEVRKLYPDAELPSFRVESRDERTLVLRYVSCKPLADLATGVIKGAATHLGEKIAVKHRPVTDGAESYVRFEVSRLA